VCVIITIAVISDVIAMYCLTMTRESRQLYYIYLSIDKCTVFVYDIMEK